MKTSRGSCWSCTRWAQRNYLNDRYSDWSDVPGAGDGLAEGYLDLDVYEVARAFTGWSVGDGRWLAEGEEAPRPGDSTMSRAGMIPTRNASLAANLRRTAARWKTARRCWTSSPATPAPRALSAKSSPAAS